ncbi:hypothetical protein DL95DRAFT_418473 [Leptodontidium sp. 2 PMI_412]|nr:hypothetical protein DL95DRAFT_418473 [Leptodontidium sp. 2 PMI_412]
MNSQIARLEFSKDAVMAWELHNEKHSNWRVVYIFDDGLNTAKASSNELRDIYVGTTLNAASRMYQHLKTPTKQHFKNIRLIIDEKFNKSVCLDLESYLIKMLAGDSANRVLNRNNSITETQYYRREMYPEGFHNIFERLKAEGIFTRSILEIENSDLFKLSLFKALTENQANSVEEIVNGLLINNERGSKNAAQSVRPADLSSELLSSLVADTRAAGRYFQLGTQMRVQAGSDFVSYVRRILDPRPLEVPRVKRDFGEYEFRAFDSVAHMRDQIFQRNAEVGLSRMVAGYAWQWKSKKDRNDKALEEVGSIHMVQGFDLNYVGVIIGLDLRFDPERRRLFIDRNSYFDKKGKCGHQDFDDYEELAVGAVARLAQSLLQRSGVASAMVDLSPSPRRAITGWSIFWMNFSLRLKRDVKQIWNLTQEKLSQFTSPSSSNSSATSTRYNTADPDTSPSNNSQPGAPPSTGSCFAASSSNAPQAGPLSTLSTVSEQPTHNSRYLLLCLDSNVARKVPIYENIDVCAIKSDQELFNMLKKKYNQRKKGPRKFFLHVRNIYFVEVRFTVDL